MSDAKRIFASKFRMSSESYQNRVDAIFGDGELRPKLNDFWSRHETMITDWTREHCFANTRDGYVESASMLQGAPVTREQLGEITTQLFLAIFTATREDYWMKALSNVALSSWLVDNENDMNRYMSGYNQGLIHRLWDSTDNPAEIFEDLLFVNRVILLEFEMIASIRTELQLRYSQELIDQKGSDFVSGLADKIDISLKASETVNAAAVAANDKISGLRNDTTEAAAISEQSAQAMQDAAKSAGDLLHTLNNVSSGLTDGKNLLVEAVEQAERTANDNAEVANEVAAIEEVVKTISEIADQTNILALNASIEAARAGSSGAGFAVVAQEVKNLANQTAKATDSVSVRINAIQNSTKQSGHSSGAMVETTSRLRAASDSLLDSLNRELGAFSKITDAVDETAQGAVSIGELVANINRDTDAVSGLVEELSNSSKTSAGKLAGLVEETSGFVQAIGKQ